MLHHICERFGKNAIMRNKLSIITYDANEVTQSFEGFEFEPILNATNLLGVNRNTRSGENAA